VADAFEQWRYVYEVELLDVCTSDLQQIAEAIDRAVTARKPELTRWPT
jgi:hypothetical protein